MLIPTERRRRSSGFTAAGSATTRTWSWPRSSISGVMRLKAKSRSSAVKARAGCSRSRPSTMGMPASTYARSTSTTGHARWSLPRARRRASAARGTASTAAAPARLLARDHALAARRCMGGFPRNGDAARREPDCERSEPRGVCLRQRSHDQGCHGGPKSEGALSRLSRAVLSRCRIGCITTRRYRAAARPSHARHQVRRARTVGVKILRPCPPTNVATDLKDRKLKPAARSGATHTIHAADEVSVSVWVGKIRERREVLALAEGAN